MSRRTFTLLRHGESTYNARGLVNGDPTVEVGLTDLGREQAAVARGALAGRRFDLAIHTRFPRTAETLAIVLQGRHVPLAIYPQLDDVHLGMFEGRPVEEYRAWRAEHTPHDPPPGEGESRVDALYRYMTGFERMLAEDADQILAILHDVPIRFLVNGSLGADPLDGPVTHVDNAGISVFDDLMVERALDAFRERLGH